MMAVDSYKNKAKACISHLCAGSLQFVYPLIREEGTESGSS